MTKRIGGMRRKTREKLSRPKSQKGKVSITRYFQVLKKGDRVRLAANSSVHHGMYFPRFHGKTGVVLQKKGNCYEIQIYDFTKAKTLIVHPVHLKKA